MMQVTEIFRSIQGESTYAGLPCIFVRLTGCNLRCTWCDTAYAFHGGNKMAVDEVLGRVDELSGRREGGRGSGTVVPLVELTGGEPLLQEEVYPLAERLLAAGYTVMIETSGQRYVGRLPKEVIKIVDVKCPHSGEPDTFSLENLEALQPHDELKFVLTDRTDYEFARDFVLNHGLAERVHAILFSPAFEKGASGSRDTSHCLLDPQELAQWILDDNAPARLSLQIHKLIWDPAAKGV